MAQLNRGQHLQEFLKQPQYQPMSPEKQVMVLFAGTNGFSDQIPLERMRAWEAELLRFMETSHPEIGQGITADRKISARNRSQIARSAEGIQRWLEC